MGALVDGWIGSAHKFWCTGLHGESRGTCEMARICAKRAQISPVFLSDVSYITGGIFAFWDAVRGQSSLVANHQKGRDEGILAPTC